jgi:hypothetical protein
MENLFNDFENSVAHFLLKSFLILGSIFIIGIAILIFKDAITFNNGFTKGIVFVLIGSVTLISILSSINLYNKIK